MQALNLLSYFRTPFPSREGFSPYRMPGTAVHGPLILCAALAGYFLCWQHPMLRPLLLVWVLAGIYLGRDVTILCHYNPLLTLLSWAVFVLVIMNPSRMAKFGAAHAEISLALSLAVAAILVLVALSMTRVRTQADHRE